MEFPLDNTYKALVMRLSNVEFIIIYYIYISVNSGTNICLNMFMLHASALSVLHIGMIGRCHCCWENFVHSFENCNFSIIKITI